MQIIYVLIYIKLLPLVSYHVLTNVSPHDYWPMIKHSSHKLKYFIDRVITN